jgi:phospholipid transport system transporter-binding protein
MSAFRFPAEVGHGSANAVLAAALQSPPAGGERVYDLSACQHFDSSLIAVLLQLMRDAQAAGVGLRFEGQDERLLKLAGLYGLAGLLFGAQE